MSSSIKVVDVNNEEAKEEEPTEEIEESKEEQPEETNIENETVEEQKEEPKEENEPKEELKNNSKTERYRDKMITCPKCSKSMLLRSYRYKHEKNCQGNIENRQVKPQSKPKPKPKPVPQTIYEESSEEEEEQPQQKPIKKKQPVQQQQISNPLNDITNHYHLLQKQFRQQKQERYNNLCQDIFKSKPRKR